MSYYFYKVPEEFDMPMQIANLIGKTFVFQFELNDYNLKQGCEIYTMKKLFVLVIQIDNSVKLDQIIDVSTFILNLNEKKLDIFNVTYSYNNTIYTIFF